MSQELRKGPNLVNPETASAIGSRNSRNRTGRNEYKESQIIVEEEVDKVLNHIQAKLPPEVLEKLDILGGVKPKLHNYFNQNTQNMLNRYLVTVEDELGKKYRDLIDKDEYKNLAEFTPREITDLLDSIGGSDKFNTGEIEQSLVNIYGHLQGHIQRGVYELENETNSQLRQKTDVGAFVRGENSYAIAKCSFKNNAKKPKAVVDVKLAINILDGELISPIHHFQEPIKNLLREGISEHIHHLIEKELNVLNNSLLDEGKEELTDSEVIFEKLKALDNYTDDEVDNEQSKRYSIVAKKFMDSIDVLGHEIAYLDYNPLQIRENVKKIIDDENIRNRGFNTSVNNLTSILDTSKMGYQHVDNFKNARKCIIREYEDIDIDQLPDERFKLTLVYFDQPQLVEMRVGYDLQYDEFVRELDEVFEVVKSLYNQHKTNTNKIDFDDIADRYLNQDKEDAYGSWFSRSKKEDNSVDEEAEKLWNELIYIEPKETVVEKENKTNRNVTILLKRKIVFFKQRLAEIYKNQNPSKRVIVENRVQFLEDKFQEFAAKINPYHIQPGLVLEVDITSVKRKRTTMMAMANVLNEYLSSISKGFADKAFAGFSRRRSTTRGDMDEEFASVEELDDREGATSGISEKSNPLPYNN